MITNLPDNQSWSKELLGGNAQFLELGNTVWLVSQVREDNSFGVFKSDPVPPNPGPGYSFTEVASYTFADPNTSFDPVITYDGSQYIHIVGTADDANGNVNFLKFTLDTQTNTLSAPSTLVTASYVRDAFDICMVNGTDGVTSGYKFVAVSCTDPQPVGTANPLNVTQLSVSNNVITVTVGNTYILGDQVKLTVTGGPTDALNLDGTVLTIENVNSGSFSATMPFVTKDIAAITSIGDGLVATVAKDYSNAHWLLGLLLDTNDLIVDARRLDSSPLRSGNVFGSVTLVSPDGISIEVYYEAHPKLITNQDQLFAINLLRRDPTPDSITRTIVGEVIDTLLSGSFLYDTGVVYTATNVALTKVMTNPPTNPGEYYVDNTTGIYHFNAADDGVQVTLSYMKLPFVWGSITELKTFVGRHTDNRLTVVPVNNTRTLVQTYFSQLVHQNSLVGNMVTGYYDGTNWLWHLTPGQSLGGSIAETTLSVSQTQGTFISYLLLPIYSNRGGWSPRNNYKVNDKVQYTYAPDPMQPDTVVTTDFVALTATMYRGVWSSSKAYVENDIVLVSTTYYTCKSAVGPTLVSPAADTTNWALTLSPDQDPTNWVAPVTAWPLKTALLGLTDLSLTDQPGFYNNLNFSWLRGSKTVLDDDSLWAVLGERLKSDGSIDRTYVSKFDVPPKVNQISPATIDPLYRAQSRVLTAVADDADTDPITFNWVVNDPDANIVLTPALGGTASLLVNRAVGGAERYFTIAVVAVDYKGVTPLHPPMVVSNIDYVDSTQTVTVTVDAASLAAGEVVLLYGLTNAPFLNNSVVTITSATGTDFTGTVSFNPSPFPPADYSGADTGFAISQPQFAYTTVHVPANAAPVVTMPIIGTVDRNSTVGVVPTIAGVSDPDDATTYLWVQTAGTAVETGPLTGNSLSFKTNGVNIHGETLTFQFTVNDGVNPPVVSTINITVAAYNFSGLDTKRLSRSVWAGKIADRNTEQDWGTLDVSTMLTNFADIKRCSVLDGTDRYLIISPSSVLVYGGINPNLVLLRKLLIPGNIEILDAMHTENDYTLVLDAEGNLYRYSTAPLITTDNPDTTINLSTVSNLSFKKIFATSSFGNVRVLALSGDEGCVLLQVRNTDLQLQGIFEISTGSQKLYGANNVQWIRTSNVENLRTGKVLLGTVASLTSSITSIAIAANTLTVTTPNSFTPGQLVQLSGLTSATFLNGVTLSVLTADTTKFTASFEYGAYAVQADTGTVTALTGIKTYETLIDLSHGEIIGTWDASKLKNQYVTSGEILFEPNSGYSGRPSAPTLVSVQNQGAIAGQPNAIALKVTWNQSRPDLVTGYSVQYSSDNLFWQLAVPVYSGAIQSVTYTATAGKTYYFRVYSSSADGNSPNSNVIGPITT